MREFRYVKVRPNSTGVNLFKCINGNKGKIWESYSELAIKTPEQCHWSRFYVVIVNFEHFSSVSIVNFEQLNAS